MNYDRNDFGRWDHDQHGIPRFHLTAADHQAPYAALKHLVATGRLSAFADRWGNLHLFTTDGATGYVDIARNAHQCRSGLYSMLRVDGRLVSLLHGELGGRRSTVYGAGRAAYSGELDDHGLFLGVEQTFVAPPDNSPFVLGRFQLTNQGDEAVEVDWILASDVSLVDNYKSSELPDHEFGDGFARLSGVHDGLGDVFLAGPAGWQGMAPSRVAIGLSRVVRIPAGETLSVTAAVGYGSPEDCRQARATLDGDPVTAALRSWGESLSAIEFELPEEWMLDECRWDAGQLLSFVNYDASLGENYVSLGGYGWRGFNQRELGEDAMALLPWFPGLALSCLRFMALTQYATGDMPQSHNFSRANAARPAPDSIDSSDTEIWFLLGCGELGRVRPEALDEAVRYCDGPEASLWDHCRRAFSWLRDEIGRGRHGLVKSWHGDWNDYLFPMGAGGEGESMMNTGMAARACDLLAEHARQRGDQGFARQLAAYRDELREAAGHAFTGTHFVRGYTDAGRPVGGEETGRVFINAQSWPSLGGCGTARQRRMALSTAVSECETPRGLCLVSRPFPSPPPSDVSSLPIPAGEGENGGVWPQAVAWMVWALAEQGMTDEALAAWKRCTLRRNAALYPGVPFGLFNGPDCYNSHLAGDLAHWTQVQLWDRRVHTPMNPSVAWQAMAMHRILAAVG